MQFNSLVASGSRITSIALSTLQSLCVIVAAHSSATTEIIVLSPSAHPLQLGAQLFCQFLYASAVSPLRQKAPNSGLQLFAT
jgi:hypothetical protein